ncbi:hypothetical protein [Secundilactobacillus similis]|uniref:Death-on-curing family protein n=1 Tax=Secundilactobacillus similis DSM 23365 = JCM 2765 TaxID=1423804 RepID=A0A0R2F9G0_9LACO|nr:hypothetical protein [Secundilactobacillus similis]KRN24969.1 hypothetical protein FD14_GL000439 [Secundilactobacillus similis DSM 23365 = JCM 2765]
MRYLTADELVAINSHLALKEGKQPGIAKAEQLNKIIAVPQANFYDHSLREMVANKTGFLLAAIISGKPFSTNNLQTAVIAVAALADLNDYELTFSTSQLADLAVELEHTDSEAIDYDRLFKLFDANLKMK